MFRNLFFLFLLVFFVYSNNQLISGELKKFTSDKYKFSFDYNSSWSINKATGSDIFPNVEEYKSGIAVLDSPKETNDEKKWNFLLIRGDNVPYFDVSIIEKKPYTNEDFVNNYDKLFELILGKRIIYVKENPEIIVNGNPAFELIYETDFGKTVRTKCIIVFKNGYQYIFRFWDFADKFSEFEKIFDEIILSIKFE